MTRFEQFIALNGRRFFRIVLGFKDQFETTSDNCEYFRQEASDLILRGLNSPEPFAVSRFGHSELRAVLTYLHIQDKTSRLNKIASYIAGSKVEPWWFDHTVSHITNNAGVFPKDLKVIEDYCKLTIADAKEINVLGSWLGGERWIKQFLPNTKFMRFHDFYHFLHKRPWTLGLTNQKVLVVHPFAKSIEQQYKIKEKIFFNDHTLPDFQLITYPSVQSIAGNIPKGFSTWFDALEKMKSDISKIDFDIAILGCGAYGMSLAAFIKRDLKRKAIHLGGNTQILFGIKGSRWETDSNFMHIFNSEWVKPSADETPSGHKSIDNNCYW
jgi:hypothetical protein